MKSDTLAPAIAGAACAMIGPTVVQAFTSNPTDQAALSLMIAGSVVVAVLVGFRRQ